MNLLKRNGRFKITDYRFKNTNDYRHHSLEKGNPEYSRQTPDPRIHENDGILKNFNDNQKYDENYSIASLYNVIFYRIVRTSDR